MFSCRIYVIKNYTIRYLDYKIQKQSPKPLYTLMLVHFGGISTLWDFCLCVGIVLLCNFLGPNLVVLRVCSWLYVQVSLLVGLWGSIQRVIKVSQSQGKQFPYCIISLASDSIHLKQQDTVILKHIHYFIPLIKKSTFKSLWLATSCSNNILISI